jgi:hypothetical protein
MVVCVYQNDIAAAVHRLNDEFAREMRGSVVRILPGVVRSVIRRIIRGVACPGIFDYTNKENTLQGRLRNSGNTPTKHMLPKEEEKRRWLFNPTRYFATHQMDTGKLRMGRSEKLVALTMRIDF